MRKFPIALVIVMLLSAIVKGQAGWTKTATDDMVTFAAVDPLLKIFKETAFFDDTDPMADVAIGEHASFQFVVRSTKTIRHLTATVTQLSRNLDLISHNSHIGFVGYTHVGRPLPNPPKDKLNPVSGYYPDPILDTPAMDLIHFTTQPVWLTVAIPQETAPGDYLGLCTLSGTVDGKTFSTSHRFLIRVYPVRITQTSLWVTNWFGIDKTQMKQLSDGKDSVMYSERFWYWLHMAAKKMKEYDQNVVIVPPTLVNISYQQGKYSFDFTRYDRFVQTFIDEKTIGLIEGGHVGGRMGNWDSQFGLFVPFWHGDTIYYRILPLKDSTVQNFYRVFMPALMKHLQAKGWDKMYLQHLCDEPETSNEKSYGEIGKYIKSLAPGIKTIDAVHSHGVDNTVDVWVPQLDFYDTDYAFYQERKKAGDEIWFYTCLSPQGEYANRFIEQPLIKTRLLHWINFRFGATGYLHWGWNFWSPDPMQETSGIIPEAGNIMPGGDAFITYPGHGEILSSIRLEAMRDGIVDYELLKMLEKQSPDAARETARQTVYEFSKYDLDITAFRAKRRKILELLSAQH